MVELPLDIRRKILTLVEDDDTVESYLNEWDTMTYTIKENDHATMILLRQETAGKYVCGGRVLIAKSVQEVIHVSMFRKMGPQRKVSYNIWWTSPQFSMDERFLLDMYNYNYDDIGMPPLQNQPGFHMYLLFGTTPKIFLKNLLYAAVIFCQQNSPEILTPTMYKNILTRFRKQELLTLFPPHNSPPVPSRSRTSSSPKSPRTRMLQEGERFTQERRKILQKREEMLTQGMLGHNEAVRTLLRKRKNTKSQ